MTVRILLALAAAAVVILIVLRFIDSRIAQRWRVSPADFREKDLRANSLLADVPLHDVWAVHLPGSSDLSVGELRTILSRSEESPGFTSACLVKVRMVLGSVFGWDDEKHFDHAASYIHRLSERDWRESFDEPGSMAGMFRVVYTFERELVAEIINGTVHAFLAMALEPNADGQKLYYAVFVKPNSWLTPFYMGLIEPFRRFVIYPSMMRSIESTWNVAIERRGVGTEPALVR